MALISRRRAAWSLLLPLVVICAGCSSDSTPATSATATADSQESVGTEAGEGQASSTAQTASQPESQPATRIQPSSAQPSEPRLSAETLTIGSPAPSLAIEHWVSDRGETLPHIEQFATGKVYVVEFWATWCGPCVASMPHLVSLQNEYVDRGVQIISISREGLDVVEKFLTRPYQAQGGGNREEGNGEEGSGEEGSEGDAPATEDVPATYGELTSAYCLTCDPDGSTDRDYMKAAGQGGIPCAFLVGKTGQIEWIGHPMAIDEPLEKVVSDTWDRAAYLAEFQREQQRDVWRMELIGKLDALVKDEANIDVPAVLQVLEAAKTEVADDEELTIWLNNIALSVQMTSALKQLEAGEYEEAEAALKRLEENADARLLSHLVNARVQSYLKANEYDRASTALENYAANDSSDAVALEMLAQTIVTDVEAESAGGDAAKLLAATEKTIRELLVASPDDIDLLETLAHLQAARGDLEAAIATAEEAAAHDEDGQGGMQEYLELLREQQAEGAATN